MRTRLALPTVLAGTLVLGGVASAQAVPDSWDMIVSVRMDRVGADLVSAGPRMANYPPELLRSQLDALGQRLGSGARGVNVRYSSYHPGDPAATLLQGTCGVDGLIDRTTGRLSIAPIAQAFAGAPAPYTIHRMLVSFDGERPGARTIARHTAGKTSDLAFLGRLVGSSIEYRVELHSQDPARLVVHEDVPSPKSVVAPARSRADATTVGLVALAVIAAGALVYCLILLLGRRPLSKS